MARRRIAGRFPALAALAAMLAGLAFQQSMSPQPEPEEDGRQLFLRYCAPCHGTDAKGNGPAASSLKNPPPDLTRIQKPGERFPAGRIADIIEGAKVVDSHGSREMPVWGILLRNELGYSKSQEQLSRVVKYLESIQAERQ